MKIFFLAQKGLHLKESDVIVRKASNLEIKSNNPIEIDGDYFANGPAQIIIENLAIRFKI